MPYQPLCRGRGRMEIFMKTKIKKEDIKNYSYDILDKENTVASATECTGLIQIPPTNSAESESYSDIYVIPNQVNDFEACENHGKTGERNARKKRI